MVEKSSRKIRGRRQEKSAADGFLRTHVAELATMQRPVVLIAGPDSSSTLPQWRAAFQYRLHVVVPSEDAMSLEGINTVVATTNDQMTAYILSIGPVAAVIDEEAQGLVERLQRWQRFFFHVAAGGSYTAPVTAGGTVWDAATLALTSRRIGVSEIEELRRSIRVTHESAGYTVTVKDRDHLVKVRDEDALAVLPTRLGANNVRLLGSRGSSSTGNGLQVLVHGASNVQKLPAATMRAPELTLREFRGGTAVESSMLAVQGSTVLPSSFKHPWRAWNDRLQNVNDHVALRRDGGGAAELLAGSFYDVTGSVDGDEGHFITESLPKLWGWSEAKKRDSSLRALYRTNSSGSAPVVFQRTLLEAFGISPEDIHIEHRDVVVERFVSGSQAWQNGGRHYAHPVNREVWAAIRAALVTVDRTSPAKVFVTRGAAPETPGPRNRGSVEQLFAQSGFAVVDVDEMDVAEQAQVFGNATTIAGFAGSGMYRMLFADHLEKVVVLTHEANTGRNEHLFASLLADEIHYFWSRPDVMHPAGKFSSEAFNSAWDFDVEGNRDALTALLG